MDPLFFTPGKPHLMLIAAVYQYIADGMLKRVLLSMPPRAGKCVDEDTLVFCDRGYIPIKELKPGGKVYSMRGKKLVRREVQNIFCTEKKAIKIKTRTGREIILSEEHRMFTQDGYKTAKDITINDFLHTLNRVIDSEFEIDDDELKLISYMLFEGHCKKSMSSFTAIEDCIIHDFKDVSERLEIRLDIRDKQGTDAKSLILRGNGINHNKPGYSHHGNELLEKYGLLNHLCYTKRLPVEFFKMSLRQKYMFIGIMIATDGWADKKGLHISLANEGLINDIQMLLSTCGIVSSKTFKKNHYANAWSLNIGRSQVGKIYHNCDLKHKQGKCGSDVLNKTGYSFSDIYPNALVKDKIKNTPYARKYRVDAGKNFTVAKFDRMCLDIPGLSELSNEDFIWDKVVSIERLNETRRMVDIQVEDTENFIANGFVSHNSYITSMFCAWMIGREPTGTIMRNSYAAPLALKFSYDIRQMVRSDKFIQVFPGIRLKQDKKALEDWAVEQSSQSSYFCSGVLGSLTGKGCNLVAILDDPVKSMEVALSELQLENIWNWLISVHNTRIERDCPEIHIATRWSKRDPIGRIKSRDGFISFDQFLEDPEKHSHSWVDVLIPAFDENGESFCNEIKTTAQLREIELSGDSFIWDALYMQTPVDVKGLAFPESELQFFDEEEFNKYENSNSDSWDGVVGYTDTADKGGDWLGSITGKLKGEYCYITDVIYTLEQMELTEPKVAQMIIDTRTDVHTIETNSGGRGFARIIRNLIKGKTRCTIREIDNMANKDTRIIMKGGQIRKYFKFRRKRVPGSDYAKYFDHLTNYVLLSQKRDDAADVTVGLAEALSRPKLEVLQRL